MTSNPADSGRGRGEPDGAGGNAAEAAAGRPPSPAAPAGESPEPGREPTASAPPASAGRDAPDAKTWLRDRERAQDSADYGRGLDEAASGLTGVAAPAGPMHVGVMIHGGVHGLTGDILGGSKHAASGTGGFLGDVIVGQVTADILDGARRSYVPPDSYQRLLDKLRDRSIALLHAPAGWGRTTTGLRVLSQLCPEVWKLSPDTDLRALEVDKLKDGAGYLVELRAVDQLMRLKVPHLERLGEKCAKHGIRLLATTDEDIPLAHLASDFGVSGGPRPGPRVVLERHLQIGLPGHPLAHEASANMDAILGREDIQNLISEFADESLSMRRLAELSGKLLRVASGDLTADQARSYFSEQSQQDFTDWFAGQPDFDQRALLIALATLNGMPYYTVARLAKSLASVMRAAEGSDDDKPQVFGTTRTERLAAARAEITDGVDQTPYGHVRVETVRFCNETYPRRVLEWVWNEYDSMRPLLIDWLRGAGVDSSRQVRIRAAAATGLLAVLDFEWIRRELLLPWADSPGINARESAVAALRIPSQDMALSAHVVRMIREWTAVQSTDFRRLTAARALGAGVGRFIRDEALGILAGLADRDEPLLTYAISDSVAELFVAPEAGAQADVVRALTNWTGRHEPVSRQDTGMLCFLRLAFDYLTEEPSDGVTWPALLWLAEHDDEQMNLLAILMSRATHMPSYLSVVQDVLTSWAETSADSPRVTASLVSFVRCAAVDDRAMERFQYCIQRIARGDGKGHEVADALLKALSENR